MTILITGAYGFIGSNLSRFLKENNYCLWALDVLEKQNKSYAHYYSWGDLDFLPWNEVDVIIHLAGKAHDIKNQTEVQDYFDVNTELTKKVFDRFLLSSAKQFIFFSSVKTVIDAIDSSFITEDIAPKPVGPYGESKLAAEKYILDCFDPRNDGGKSVYILRPCMIHGPGNKGNLNLLYNVVSKAIPWPLGAFDNKRSYLNSWNLSYIIEQFILQNPESGVYNLADDEPVSTNELVKLIAQSKGKKAKIWNCNKRIVKSIARIGDFCKFPLNSDRLQKLTATYIVSNQKGKQALGIKQLPVSAIEGLERTLRTFEN